jgi:uncharacterized protein (TIGR00730 family)
LAASLKKKTIKTVGVFCSSRIPSDPAQVQAAYDVGAEIGKRGWALSYGGGKSGLMGVVAQSVLDNGGQVFGVITKAFKESAGYAPLVGSSEKVVTHLHTRKAGIIRRADAFITLAGGIGTLDEKWEVAALNDMLIAARSPEHLKPMIVMNINGLYEEEKTLMRKLIGQGLIHPGREKMIRSADSVTEAFTKLDKWSEEGIMRGIDLAPAIIEPSVHAANAAQLKLKP